MKNSRFNENLQPDHLVAYIDLLGWSDKLLSANTYADIAPLLNVLKIFHEKKRFRFNKEDLFSIFVSLRMHNLI